MTKVGILKNALMTIGNFIDIPIPPAVLELCKQLLLHSPACYQVHIVIQNRVAQSVISDHYFFCSLSTIVYGSQVGLGTTLLE